MSLTVLGALPIGAINIAAAASVGIVGPLFAELDLMLFGQFGLGALQADIALQFTAAVDLQLSLAVSISNPFESIAALANLLASLQISLPTVSVDMNMALSANIALQAALGLKLGGIIALVEAALAVKLPAVDFFAALAASLTAGPVFLVGFDYAAPGGLSMAGSAIQAQFNAGLVSGPSSIAPVESAMGIVLVTKEPSVYATLGTVLKVN